MSRSPPMTQRARSRLTRSWLTRAAGRHVQRVHRPFPDRAVVGQAVMRLEGLDRGLQLGVVAVGVGRRLGLARELAGRGEAGPHQRDARVGRAGLQRRLARRHHRPAAALLEGAQPPQRLLQPGVDEVIRLERLDAGVDRRGARDLIERDVERRRADARVDVPARVERRRQHPPVAHVVDQRRRGIGDEHLGDGSRLRRGGLAVRVERGGDGGEMIVGRRQAVGLDRLDRLEDRGAARRAASTRS